MFRLFILSIIFFVLFFSVYYFKIKIGVNISRSMPMGIYFMTGDLDKNINRNDVVVFCPSKDLLNFFSERNYISKKIIGSCEGGFSPFVKHVIALRGDKIEIMSFI